ncbi:class I SAM-dependent methyltransferase [Acidihalobacter prosperus]
MKLANLDPEEALIDWYQGALGSRIWARLQEEMPNILTDMFGYVGVQIGLGSLTPSLLTSSRVKTTAGLSSCLSSADMLGRPEALPFGAETLDLVILPHMLELSSDPHQVLREVDRVLVPEGHAVFIGFNPVSLWGLWVLSGGGPWSSCWRSGRSHLYTQARLKDWLGLLGFDIRQTRYLLHRLPLYRAFSSDEESFIETFCYRYFPVIGGIRIIAARKRKSTLTPIKLNRRKLQLLSGSVTIKPTPRVISSEQHD